MADSRSSDTRPGRRQRAARAEALKDVEQAHEAARASAEPTPDEKAARRRKQAEPIDDWEPFATRLFAARIRDRNAKRLFRRTGAPGNASLLLVNKMCVATAYELLATREKIRDEADAVQQAIEQDDLTEADRKRLVDIHGARRMSLEAERVELRKDAFALKSLTDAMLRALKVGSDVKVDQAVNNVKVEGSSALREGMTQPPPEATVH